MNELHNQLVYLNFYWSVLVENAINVGNFMKEIWRDVQGYNGYYKISNIGNVMGRSGNILKPAINKDGYKKVIFCVNKIQKTFTVHRLVASAFIKNPKNKEFVNHIDLNKTNNNVNNLEWVTNKENLLHALNNGVVFNHKLNSNEVIDIVEGMSDGFSQSEIARYYNVSVMAINKISLGKSWSRVTGIIKK